MRGFPCTLPTEYINEHWEDEEAIDNRRKRSQHVITGLIKYAAGLALRKAASIPADVAFRFTNLPPVLAYSERRYTASLTSSDSLSVLENTAVAQLELNGVFVADLASLGCSDDDAAEVMACGNRLAALLAGRAAAAGGARPAVTISKPADLMEYPAIYRCGLNPMILSIVKAYLRAPVAYDGPLVFHAPADGRETGNRRWHVDREDRRIVKVGLYLHDVSESGGPFQLVHHELRRAGGAFHYKVLDTRQLEQKLGTEVTSRDTVTCTGKGGTLVFAETGRFYHRGKPATDRERATIFFSYFARSPCHPFFCGRSGLSRTDLTELIKGLSPEQQSAALWRDKLPLIARLIPPSLV